MNCEKYKYICLFLMIWLNIFFHLIILMILKLCCWTFLTYCGVSQIQIKATPHQYSCSLVYYLLMKANWYHCLGYTKVSISQESAWIYKEKLCSFILQILSSLFYKNYTFLLNIISIVWLVDNIKLSEVVLFTNCKNNIYTYVLCWRH